LTVSKDHHAVLSPGQSHIDSSIVRDEPATRGPNSGEKNNSELSALGLVNRQHEVAIVVRLSSNPDVAQSVLQSPALSCIGSDDCDVKGIEVSLRLFLEVADGVDQEFGHSFDFWIVVA
jgi:hypothetical protein